MRSSPKSLAAIAAATLSLTFPLSAAAIGNWYLGGNIGQATTDVDDGTVTARLSDQGLTGTASASDTTRSGWRLFGGYAFNRYFDLEVGYTQLGDIEMTLSGTGPLTAAQLEEVRPATGAGFELAARGKYPFTERLSGFVRAGLFHWAQQYDLSGGGSGNFSGDDMVCGLGAEWRLNDRWSTHLSWDRYTVAKDETSFVALGLTWHLHASATALPALQPPMTVTPEPAPPATEAVATAEPVAQAATPAQATPPAVPQWVVRFAFKRTKLQGHESAVAETAEYLAIHPEARVRITGHTDNSGAEDFNPYLSRLRAQAAADALAARGVDRARITVEGRGAAKPIADNKTRSGRAQNRRAEIVIHRAGEAPHAE